MPGFKKTTTAAREIGVPVFTIHNWIRYGVIPAPQRDDSGHYVWGPADIETARRVRDERLPVLSEPAIG